jgi:hypothetical protein
MTEKNSVNLFYVRIALIRHALLFYVKIFLKKQVSIFLFDLSGETSILDTVTSVTRKYAINEATVILLADMYIFIEERC